MEALKALFERLNPNTGAAFVVVTHLDPEHKAMLATILSRSTLMPVCEARSGVQVEADHVYIIPPNRDIALEGGALQLSPPESPHGFRLPIDHFFRSLAAEQGENSVGVILSGMGSDGTLGARAIRDQGGGILVQSPASAQFDLMPRSAVQAGVANLISDPEGLAQALARNLATPPATSIVGSPDNSTLLRIFQLLLKRTGHDLSIYKRGTLLRGLGRRLGLHQLPDLPSYLDYLQHNSQELDLLFKELLIGVTGFFRDPEAFLVLQERTLPQLLASKPPADPLRCWVTGCSTGEEVYSLAILLLEARGHHGPSQMQMFATDIDPDAILRARRGIYPLGIARELSKERLERFFTLSEGSYRVKPELRGLVTFAVHNALQDPPFTRLDFLSCRNLLIYLNAEAQTKLIRTFHYSLNPGGVLFLGSAEGVGGAASLFTADDPRAKIFLRKPGSLERTRDLLDARPGLTAPWPQRESKAPTLNLQEIAQRALLEEFSPPAVVVNASGDVLYVHGTTGKYLETAVGKASLNVFAMAKPGLRRELSGAFRASTQSQEARCISDIPIEVAGGRELVDLHIRRLPLKGGGEVYLLSFVSQRVRAASAEPSRPASDSESQQLERELLRTREHLQSVIEDMEVTQEELRSTNEELQSANEELTSSKEEMQSLHEELVTLNTELQLKVEELSASSDDMRYLLDNTQVATIYLERDLTIKRYTQAATRFISLIPGDLGRPISQLATNLDTVDLVADAEWVLHNLTLREIQVQTRDGHWFLMRILPYRTSDEQISGVVVTFTDVHALKQMEDRLRGTQAEAQSARQVADAIIDAVRESMLVIDREQRVLRANQAFCQSFALPVDQVVGQTLAELPEAIAAFSPALEMDMTTSDAGQLSSETPPLHLNLSWHRLPETEPARPTWLLTLSQAGPESPP